MHLKSARPVPRPQRRQSSKRRGPAPKDSSKAHPFSSLQNPSIYATINLDHSQGGRPYETNPGHCRRRSLGALRRSLRRAERRELPLTDTIPAPEPEERPALEAVLALPPEDRAVIHLFYYEGYSAQEIARITGQLPGTVRSRLSRARGKLRSLLSDQGYSDRRKE